jgi:DNA-binding beta-propeller fold protein YncE
MLHRSRLFTTSVALVLLLMLTGCSKMNTEGQSAKAAPPLLKYVEAWGMKGSEPGHLDQPTSIAVDALGNIFIADVGSHFIHKFGPQGTPLLSFQDDWIKFPKSIAVDSGGGIYTADAKRGSISIFFPGGDRYRDFKLKTRPNEEDDLGVAVGDDGMVFVLDSNAGEVFAYTSGLRLARTWRPVAKGRPSAIASGPDSYVYVLNASDNRIVRYTHDGHVVSEIATRPSGAGRRLGDQFAVSNGYVFLMDGDGLTLHILTSDGKPELDADLSPQLGSANRFIPPLAVSVRHELFVLDAPNSRVLRYRLNF